MIELKKIVLEVEYMLAISRLAEIRKMIERDKSVLVYDLAATFGVTEETIRRDLKKLESEGVLARVYGGAYSTDGVENDVNVVLRENILVTEKQVIAQSCLPFIHDGDSFFLDCSTTSLQLAHLLMSYTVTVVTNSLMIAQALASCANIRLIMIGGKLHKTSMSFVGENASLMLGQYYLDKAFLSCRSLSMSTGVSDSNEAQSAIRRLALSRSNTAFLLADHTKFGATSFAHISELRDFDYLVTDATPDPEWRTYLAQNNVKLVVNF